MKVISSCQKEPEAICILSAIGVISSATISQPHSSEKLSIYEVKHFCNLIVILIVSLFLIQSTKMELTLYSLYSYVVCLF
jgi:hypothetical protein